VEYSCVGYCLLGWILERVFGCRLDQAFRDQVLRPLDLEAELGYTVDPTRLSLAGTALEAGAERELCATMGFDPDTVPPVVAGLPEDGNARFFGGVSGNAGLFGTLRGVYRMACQFLQGSSELLTDEEIALARTELAAGPEQVRGLGWQLATSAGCSAGAALSRVAFGHTGHTGTSIWIDPTAGGAVLVLLGNRNHPGFRNVELHPVRRRFHAVAVAELARFGHSPG
jgi:CubicO group peptidase (beta-lactamase class C family)